jgi:hypothetical protein
VLAPESVPSTALLKMTVEGTGNAGNPLSSVVSGEPLFLFFMSAVKVEEAPAQIVSGLALICSCKKVSGKMLPLGLRKSFADGPLLAPHQLSSAVNDPAALKRVSPLVGTGTVLPTRREKVMVALPLDCTAPPKESAWLPLKELVVSVSGPLSTMIAPPLALVAVLPENDELSML